VTDAYAWQGTAKNPTLLALGLITTVATIVLVAKAAPLAALAVGIASLLFLISSRIRMVVDHDGVRVRWGPIGFPVNRLRLDQILDVQAVAIRPLHAGGWGYRGSRVVFRQAAALVRRGPAIRLELEKNRVFVVTVDDAATGATVLQGLLGTLGPK
jgi:hypothetical protein